MNLGEIRLILNDDNCNDRAVLKACEVLKKTQATDLISAGIDLKNLVLKLCLYSLDGVNVRSEVVEQIDRLWQSLADVDECLELLIKTLEPLLIKKPRVSEKQNKYKGLNPKLGFSFGEEDIYADWKRKGGIKSIPLCFTILRYMKISQISQNIWWITPFILNLLDDTSDLHGIRMPAVLLLRTMLDCIFCKQSSTKWISFKDTGLFTEFENMLVNFCFYLPPSYDSEDTLRIWETVIPTMEVLYNAQFIHDIQKYKMHIQKFLGEVILQNCLLRCGCKYEKLTIYLLGTIRKEFENLGEDSTALLQRLIYDLGQYLIQDPFFTAFDALILEVTKTIRCTIEVCSDKRLVAHQYDFLGLILLIYGKLKLEEQDSDAAFTDLKEITAMLKTLGCDFTDDLQHLKDINGIDYSQLLL